MTKPIFVFVRGDHDDGQVRPVEIGGGSKAIFVFDGAGFRVEPVGSCIVGCSVDWPENAEQYDRYATFVRGSSASDANLTLYKRDAHTRQITASWAFRMRISEQDEEKENS